MVNSHPMELDLAACPSGQAAQQIALKLAEAGHETVIAGGAVRDILLGKKPKDFDVATLAEPQIVLDLFSKTQKVGIAFGVVLVRDFGEAIEVATFRSDGSYSDGRRPDQVTFTDAKTDASRRDFTINGLFYDISEQAIKDYVGGLEDLKQKCIRAIGQAKQRFQEDYLRMLRAIRFAVTLNFSIEESTWQALQENAYLLKSIAPDRIHQELQKTFCHGRSNLALKLLADSNLLKAIFPDIEITINSNTESQYEEGGDLIACFCLVLHSLTDIDQLKLTLSNLRCTNDEKKEIILTSTSLDQLKLYNKLSITQKKRLLRQLKRKRVLFLLHRLNTPSELIETINHEWQGWSHKELFPDFLPMGKDLIQAGFKPGPELGQRLTELEDLALSGKISSNQEAWQHLNLS
ncbi:MAG: CCA tRNA nucleotidyltransferase [Planctomycetes bacterium]|nr:CCA tRNA nucleotidyltransferase [Planctomycetota bacterium]